MNECFGLLSIAFRRAYVEKGTGKLNADIEGQKEYNISKKWITSPYCHIEPSMAFQIDMPILIFREKGVIDDGVFEKGVISTNIPEFELSKSIDEYFESSEWTNLFEAWKDLVLGYKIKKQFKENDITDHIISCSICLGKKISPSELYNIFSNTIENSQKNSVGQRKNDYSYFLTQLESYLRVDQIDIESMYNTKGYSLHSDYIHICRNFFY